MGNRKRAGGKPAVRPAGGQRYSKIPTSAIWDYHPDVIIPPSPQGGVGPGVRGQRYGRPEASVTVRFTHRRCGITIQM